MNRGLCARTQRAEVLREKTEAAKRLAAEQAVLQADERNEQAGSATRMSLKLASEKRAEDDSSAGLKEEQHSLLSALSPLRRMVQGVLFSAFSV